MLTTCRRHRRRGDDNDGKRDQIANLCENGIATVTTPDAGDYDARRTQAKAMATLMQRPVTDDGMATSGPDLHKR